MNYFIGPQAPSKVSDFLYEEHPYWDLLCSQLNPMIQLLFFLKVKE
jgi:hypothetical protein